MAGAGVRATGAAAGAAGTGAAEAPHPGARTAAGRVVVVAGASTITMGVTRCLQGPQVPGATQHLPLGVNILLLVSTHLSQAYPCHVLGVAMPSCN